MRHIIRIVDWVAELPPIPFAAIVLPSALAPIVLVAVLEAVIIAALR